MGWGIRWSSARNDRKRIRDIIIKEEEGERSKDWKRKEQASPINRLFIKWRGIESWTLYLKSSQKLSNSSEYVHLIRLLV